MTCNYMSIQTESAFLTGIPANAAIIGIGEYTKGIVLQIKESHEAGAASLQGHFRYVHGDIASVICEHMAVSAETKRDITDALSSSSKKSFANVRQSLLELVGVEQNAALLNAHLFSPNEWAVVSK